MNAYIFSKVANKIDKYYSTRYNQWIFPRNTNQKINTPQFYDQVHLKVNYRLKLQLYLVFDILSTINDPPPETLESGEIRRYDESINLHISLPNIYNVQLLFYNIRK